MQSPSGPKVYPKSGLMQSSVLREKNLKRANEILGGCSLRSRFYYRVLGLAPAARPRREHFVFAGCTAGKLASKAPSGLKTGLNAT